MKGKYVLSYASVYGNERFLIRGLNKQGRQHVSPDEARGELADKIIQFSSVDEIEKFLRGDFRIGLAVKRREHLQDIPEPFRVIPDMLKDKDHSFRIYELDDKEIPKDQPFLTLQLGDGKMERI